MLIQRRPQALRKGHVAVEMAVIAVIFFTLLFGIMEYCRLLFLLHVSNNAARDAARYAVVKTGGGNMPGDPRVITTDDIRTIATTGRINNTNVGAGMCGMEGNLLNYHVDVFLADPAGLAQSPPIIRNGGEWTNAGFGQKIAVKISGLYQPIASGLLFLNAPMDFQVTVLASSEAN